MKHSEGTRNSRPAERSSSAYDLKRMDLGNSAQELLLQELLASYKKHRDGTIEITLPKGLTVPGAGELLNREALRRGLEYPAFHMLDAEFWRKNEQDPRYSTEAGVPQRFKIAAESAGKSRLQQQNDHGGAAPLAAVALAEACERLSGGSLFCADKGDQNWVRGAAPGVALITYHSTGVFVYREFSDHRVNSVVYAQKV